MDPNALFSGVYAIETAFHYPDKDAFVREAFRVLAPGGKLAVADLVWKHRKIAFHHRPRVWFWRNLMASPQLFTAERWRGSLCAAGFTDIRVEDISHQTLGMAPLWLNRVREHRKELDALYTTFGVALGLCFFSRAYKDFPLRYVLVKGRKQERDAEV